jgi:hypothetical protein
MFFNFNVYAKLQVNGSTSEDVETTPELSDLKKVIGGMLVLCTYNVFYDRVELLSHLGRPKFPK